MYWRYLFSQRTWYAETNCRFCQMEAYKRCKVLARAKQEPMNTGMAVCADVMYQFNLLRSGTETGVSAAPLEPTPHLGVGLPSFDAPSADFLNILWVREVHFDSIPKSESFYCWREIRRRRRYLENNIYLNWLCDCWLAYVIAPLTGPQHTFDNSNL